MNEMVFGRRYRATEKIGSGGMADVYKAVDDVLGRTVAVKVLHPRYAADPSFATRFRHEAQAAANLQSPNIVNIYDWGRDDDVYYIVMEYVRGVDLKAMIEQRGALPSAQVADIGAQVCSALAVAHGYDIIHRDIKPHNIMVQPDGTVKVMDFGIARAGNTTMTQTGSVLGTAHYVSPEQAQGRELKAQSDLYSLGVVLYEAGTGKLPFDADTPVAVALKQVNEAPTRPSRVNPNIDLGLERIIGKALAKDPQKRYSTAEEMRRDLLRVVSGDAVSAPAAVGMAPMGADKTSVMPAVSAAERPVSTMPDIRPVPEKRKILPWIAVGALLIIAGIATAFALNLFDRGIPVPDVVGKQLEEAEQRIVGAGFEVGEITEEYDDSAPAGEVLDQNPLPKANAEKGSEIDLTVSKGPETAEVPQLIGKTESEALKLIQDAGFVPQPMPSEYNATAAAGTVIKQSPGGGETVQKGSSIQFIVSRGIETTKVPDVRKKSRSDAEQLLRNAGFKVTVTESYDDKIDVGLVISQNPTPGLQVATGSTVSIVVSKGVESVTVPDIVGLGLAEAKAKIEGLGLKLNITYEPHANDNKVLEQDPTDGTQVKRGSTVNVIVDGTAP